MKEDILLYHLDFTVTHAPNWKAKLRALMMIMILTISNSFILLVRCIFLSVTTSHMGYLPYVMNLLYIRLSIYSSGI